MSNDGHHSGEHDQQRPQSRDPIPPANRFYPPVPQYGHSMPAHAWYPGPSPAPWTAQGFNAPQRHPQGNNSFMQYSQASSAFGHPTYFSIPPGAPSAQGHAFMPPHDWQIQQQPRQWHQGQQHLSKFSPSYHPSPSGFHFNQIPVRPYVHVQNRPPSSMSHDSFGSMVVNPSHSVGPSSPGAFSSPHQPLSPPLYPASPPGSGPPAPTEETSNSNSNDHPGSPESYSQSGQDRGMFATQSGSAINAFIDSNNNAGNGQNNMAPNNANVTDDSIEHASLSNIHSQQSGQQQQTQESTNGIPGGIAGDFAPDGALLAELDRRLGGTGGGATDTTTKAEESNSQPPDQAQAQGQRYDGQGGGAQGQAVSSPGSQAEGEAQTKAPEAALTPAQVEAVRNQRFREMYAREKQQLRHSTHIYRSQFDPAYQQQLREQEYHRQRAQYHKQNLQQPGALGFNISNLNGKGNGIGNNDGIFPGNGNGNVTGHGIPGAGNGHFGGAGSHGFGNPNPYQHGNPNPYQHGYMGQQPQQQQQNQGSIPQSAAFHHQPLQLRSSHSRSHSPSANGASSSLQEQHPHQRQQIQHHQAQPQQHQVQPQQQQYNGGGFQPHPSQYGAAVVGYTQQSGGQESGGQQGQDHNGGQAPRGSDGN